MVLSLIASGGACRHEYVVMVQQLKEGKERLAATDCVVFAMLIADAIPGLGTRRGG
jgi:hypothetical protein